MDVLIILIPLLPLIGATLCAVLQKTLKGTTLGWLATTMIGGSFVLAVIVWLRLNEMDPEHRVIRATLLPWLSAAGLDASISFLVDPLSMTWTLIVSGVGSLIHLYSIGYMSHERGQGRYFAFLNLFAFAMLTLVLGDNLVLLFLGWEGVGLCSYLLIGFFYDKEFAAAAGMKAFIVNRIGDLGFMLGMFLCWVWFHSLSFEGIEAALEHGAAAAPLTLIAILLFVGACGKSAQLPLYVWLPDAMAGPTPVSALIHAATMVTAGVYMVARMAHLFAASGTALIVVATVGALTALFSGTIGLAQRDIKKVLAYSTVSQLGYMFLAAGVGAFSVAAFHVTTHAFFKALLFLGAGSVIHGMSGEQDIFNMGALRKKFPITFPTFLIGGLALSGIIPFAGFFSKDEILLDAFAGHHYILWAIGVVAALLTACYTFRLIYLTFFGASRVAPEVHVHESPPTMTIPLIILAILSTVGGFLWAPVFGIDIFGHYLEPVFASATELVGEHEVSHGVEIGLMVLSLAIALTGAALGILLFRNEMAGAKALVAKTTAAWRLIKGKYFVDEIYDAWVVGPLRGLARISGHFDLKAIDGIVNAVGHVTSGLSCVVRVAQSGILHTYVFWFLVGAVALIFVII